ncbi:FecR domain-containing protein [Bacteriovorax sp. Seq25_V]|uniref:FecR family protein n=1 Tax=Bacteriovorax sp. Seq25_V TaxID=1201288 RepID=UPI000389F60B|nr:FecR family protein [Bacteriovorax sp. Seq25_V]EQC47666.1 sigma factor regulatory protein, FecR/PupR family [Bacteriovorax sp. Seq25_V]
MIRLIIALLLSSTLLAADGVVLFVKGEATAIHKNKETVLKKGSEVKSATTLTTKENSLVVIKFEDGTTIKLNSNSVISIESLLDNLSPTTISLKKGSSFFNLVKRKIIDHPTKLKVTTRTASLAVRGTTFFVAVNEIDGNTDTWMCVREGVVDSTSLSTRQTKTVNAGEGLKISSNAALTAPRFLPWTKGLNWKFEGEEGLENKLDIKDAYEDILTNDYE